jgi:hypothetical protein
MQFLFFPEPFFSFKVFNALKHHFKLFECKHLHAGLLLQGKTAST